VKRLSVVNTPTSAGGPLGEVGAHGFLPREHVLHGVDEKEYVLKPMNCPFTS